MRKTVIIILTLVLTLIPMSALAATPTATMSTEYSVDEASGNIVVDASIVDITAEEGLIYVKYDFKFDHKALELVSVTPYYPDAWQELIDKESNSIEDLSTKVSDGLYRWEIFLFEIGKGAKFDNELGLKLEFKPLSSGNTEVEILYHDMITEVVKNGMTEELISVKGNSVKLGIDLSNPETPNIDNGSIDVSSDVSDNESSEEEQSSGDLSDITNVESDDTSGYQGNVSMPEVIQNQPDVSDKETISPMFWILIGVGVIAVVTVVVFAVGSKKGKK